MILKKDFKKALFGAWLDGYRQSKADLDIWASLYVVFRLNDNYLLPWNDLTFSQKRKIITRFLLFYKSQTETRNNDVMDIPFLKYRVFITEIKNP